MSGVGFALYRYADGHQPPAGLLEDLGNHLVGAKTFSSDEYTLSLVISIALVLGGLASVVHAVIAREGPPSTGLKEAPAVVDATVAYHLGVAWRRSPVGCLAVLLVPLGCLVWLALR
jgi:hypothetical protein